MINRNIYNTIFISIAVFFSAPVVAQNKTIVKATVDRSKILIGEPIRLTLEADIPDNQPIRFFVTDSIPHFEFLSKEKIDTSNTSDGTTMSQVLNITSFDSGHWVIPAFVLTDKLVTDTIPVDVDFSPSPFDTTQPYHDIKEIIEVNPPAEEKEDKQWWWYVGAGILSLALILYLLFRKKKRPPIQLVIPPADPYKTALDELARLQKEKADQKQYYSRLVDIFRMYVLAKKGIHSLQQTTDDLVAQLQGLNIPKDQFERLSKALRLSDFVKFAKFNPTKEDDDNSFAAIKNSINAIEQMK